MNLKNNSLKFNFEHFLSSLAFGWLFINSLLIISVPDSATHLFTADKTKLLVSSLLIILSALVVFCFDSKFKKLNLAPYCFIGSLYFFCLVLCVKLSEMSTFIIMFVVLSVSMYCFNHKYKPRFIHTEANNTAVITVIAVVSVLVTACVCTISVLRYKTFSAPNYDFGIFCNMFYNMKKSGLPVTSCERDKVLSHFAVHISPVFYLLLPVYFIFSSPVTLAVLQPVIIFSSVIPLYLLAKHLNISKNATMFILLAVALFTPLASGCFYDLHENCFLVPLILWMFLFFEKDKKLLLFLSVLSVLFVKEDAFIYVAFFALYIIISRKKFTTGIAMLVFCISYFVVASMLLTKYGLGIMASRYGNLSESGSLFDAAKTIFLNPGFAVSQLLETKDGDLGKIYYIAALFCPLFFIPFLNKDFTRYILVLPVFINLLTKYPYQYNVIYQYSFGISAFLFYITLLNLSDMTEKKQRKVSFAAIFVSLLLFSMVVLPKCESYIYKYSTNKEMYNQMSQVLEIIPEDAEVTSSTYILPHLANRDIIFEDEYHKEPNTEYFVLDLRQTGAKKRADVYLNSGYELVAGVDDVLEIYKKQ